MDTHSKYELNSYKIKMTAVQTINSDGGLVDDWYVTRYAIGWNLGRSVCKQINRPITNQRRALPNAECTRAPPATSK